MGTFSSIDLFYKSLLWYKLSTLGVSIQVTKQAAGQVDSTQEGIVKMWQKVSLHKGAPLVGKCVVPFGNTKLIPLPQPPCAPARTH
jgi:hypothetical protein